MSGGALLLPRGLAGQQFLLLVTPLRGLLKVARVDGGFLLAADLGDLLVQVSSVRPDAHPLFNGRQPAPEHVQASVHPHHRYDLPRRPPTRLRPQVADELDDLLAHLVQVGAQPDQHLRGHAIALADQAEQDVSGADAIVTELQRLTQRPLQHLLAPGRERDVLGRDLLDRADDLLDLLAHRLQADPQRLQRPGRDAVALANDAKQEVLGADPVVIEHPGFFFSQDHSAPRLVGKPLEHRPPPRATEHNLAARPEHQPDGTCPGKPVMTHPRYAPVATSKAVPDGGSAHSISSWSTLETRALPCAGWRLSA